MTRAQDLARVRATGRRLRGQALELRVASPGAAVSRVGIIVPRHGNTAVARNSVKRRLREIVRTERVGLSGMVLADSVIVALPRAYRLPFAALRSELLSLHERAGS
ncbi:MAG: ribonuclease P protein component [Gemmatimonadaceae bacterium]|nr:ribonuclease P protein component [Gemmatimonadaceae bacterium]